MNLLKKLLQEISIRNDIINLILGLGLLVSILLIFLLPNNPYPILSACIFGGFVNLMNGLRLMKEPIRKMNGVTFIMLGIIVMVLGFVIVNIMKAA